ncbi:hypothetical protein EVAR_69232_1 [Eumeta japonica]|uniref:Uncharacterized protein n=1 Tax=Eumeta variegata TaxID=151549 RepID=A0A4C2A512_EUMVA|nr:hypothetical protein EVAR_69232_1 [Eumeta japonica]
MVVLTSHHPISYPALFKFPVPMPIGNYDDENVDYYDRSEEYDHAVTPGQVDALNQVVDASSPGVISEQAATRSPVTEFSLSNAVSLRGFSHAAAEAYLFNAGCGSWVSSSSRWSNANRWLLTTAVTSAVTTSALDLTCSTRQKARGVIRLNDQFTCVRDRNQNVYVWPNISCDFQQVLAGEYWDSLRSSNAAWLNDVKSVFFCNSTNLHRIEWEDKRSPLSPTSCPRRARVGSKKLFDVPRTPQYAF